MAPGEHSRPGGERLRRARGSLSKVLRLSTITDEPVLLLLLVASIIGLGIMAVEFPVATPIPTIVLPFLVGALFLRTRALILLDVVTACMVTYVIVGVGIGASGVRPASLVVLALTATFAHVIAASRERLGLQGLRGEAMLLELRDRLAAHDAFPTLPGGWQAEVVQRSAGGASFGGDFVVSSLSDDGKRLEVAVVDVSGKGVDAATRALQLSGALGGLLGSVSPDEFLVAANNYLLRLGWMEGFATAVHLNIDLMTGDYSVGSAGHPPAVHFDAGAGRWRTIAADGQMLGMLPCTSYVQEHGVLRSGDAVLLYTDGLIEVPGRDLDIGVDKLLGEAERLVRVGFADGARTLIDAVAPGGADDRALVMLWRS